MKKKQLTNKLSLNKQTLSQLDAQALNAIKGGLAVTTQDKTDGASKDTYCNCC
ncbi:MAG: class I lanthipeptide [Janthinobacterium lividum]